MAAGGAPQEHRRPHHRGKAQPVEPLQARNATSAKPRLAKPTSVSNGLGAQPMKRDAVCWKKPCMTKLVRKLKPSAHNR